MEKPFLTPLVTKDGLGVVEKVCLFSREWKRFARVLLLLSFLTKRK